MNGNKLFIDTNTAIYLLNGDQTLAGILDKKNIFVSFITQLELLGFPSISKTEEQQIQGMLDECVIIDINDQIKSEVIRLRKKYTLKLPDCIVAATAIHMDLPLISSDKGLKKIKELHLMFFEN
jgi:predicted nucleic acid-binding protein